MPRRPAGRPQDDDRTAGKVKRRNRKPRRSGLLSGRFRGGPPAHDESVRALADAEARQKKVVACYEDYLSGALTYDEVGKKHGVSGKTAWEYVQARLKQLREAGMIDDAALLRARQETIIRKVLATHMRKRERKASADVIIAALRHESQLLGLNRQVDGPRGYTLEQVNQLVSALVRGFMAAFTDESNRRKVLAVFEQVGPQFLPAAPDVDVEPEKEPTR
jgi:hypothetical protein